MMGLFLITRIKGEAFPSDVDFTFWQDIALSKLAPSLARNSPLAIKTKLKRRLNKWQKLTY